MNTKWLDDVVLSICELTLLLWTDGILHERFECDSWLAFAIWLNYFLLVALVLFWVLVNIFHVHLHFRWLTYTLVYQWILLATLIAISHLCCPVAWLLVQVTRWISWLSFRINAVNIEVLWFKAFTCCSWYHWFVYSLNLCQRPKRYFRLWVFFNPLSLTWWINHVLSFLLELLQLHIYLLILHAKHLLLFLLLHQQSFHHNKLISEWCLFYDLIKWRVFLNYF